MGGATTSTGYRALAVVERGHRGALEKQYADVFYLARELNRQMEAVDVCLRGSAATYALESAVVAQLESADDGPQAGVRTLLRDGVDICVLAEDLAALRMGPERLLSGVSIVSRASFVKCWSTYTGVWFL